MDIFENLSDAIKETLESAIQKSKVDVEDKGDNLSNDEVELAK